MKDDFIKGPVLQQMLVLFSLHAKAKFEILFYNNWFVNADSCDSL